MRLLIPARHPDAVLRAMAVAQASPDTHLLLVDTAAQGLVLQSAVALKVFQIEWPTEAPGLALTDLALRFRWRRELTELKALGVGEVLEFRAPGATASPWPRRFADWLASNCIDDPEHPVAQLPAVPRLFAHADTLARVAGLFRQVPPAKQSAYRFFWVLPHADAMAFASRPARAFTVDMLNRFAGLSTVHLHVVRVAPEGESLRLLARDPRLPAWNAAIQEAACRHVRDFGVMHALDGAALLAGLMAHADVLLAGGLWVQKMAEGFGKLSTLAGQGELLREGDRVEGRSAKAHEIEENAFFTSVCERFPFIVTA